MSEGEGDGGKLDTSSPEFQEAVKAKLAEEHGGLLSAIEKERTARKEAEKLAKKYDGYDLDEIKSLKEAQEKAEEERQREAGKFDELLAKNDKKWEERVAALETEKGTLTKSLESTLIESAAKTAISQNGGDAELLLPHVTKSAKLIEQDGRHVAVVVDAKGDPMLAPDAKTASDFMSIEHLVGNWKEAGKYPGAFAGTGSSGGGASNNGKSGGGSGTPKRIQASDTKAILANEKAIAKGEAVVVFD